MAGDTACDLGRVRRLRHGLAGRLVHRGERRTWRAQHEPGKQEQETRHTDQARGCFIG